MKFIDLFTIGEGIGFSGFAFSLAYCETHGGMDHPVLWFLLGFWMLFGFTRAKHEYTITAPHSAESPTHKNKE